MPILVLSILVQAALVVHIMKTGRNTYWIWVVVMLPLAGTIAYLLIEVLPDLAGTRSGRRTQRKIQSLINPNKDMKAAARDYAIADTVENSLRLAEECMNKRMFAEANKLYQKCLVGMHQYDPYPMFGLARSEFELGHFDRTKEILDELIEQNPDYKNPEAHLLYARTAEKLHDTQLALQEYKVLDGYYSGPEATFRYAMLLRDIGEHEQCRELLSKILTQATYNGRHYNELYKHWIKEAKREYDAI